MKITDRQICEDQIVTFKQSHILLYQGLLFLTRSTCVIVDARSHTCKSHDFIPRYDIMVVIICGKYGNNQFRTENVTERTWFSKSRSNDLEDIGQGQRSSHATHLLMLVIICTKYGKNPSKTVDATERTRFSRPRPWKYSQGQRSLHATHPLMLMMICAKYGKNASRIVEFFQGETRKICEKFKF